MEFTICCLQQTKSLQVVSMAPCAALPGVSWCRNWHLEKDDGTEPFLYFSEYDKARPTHPVFRASGESSLSIGSNILRGILSLQGFEVEKLFDISAGRAPPEKDGVWSETLLAWELTAGIFPTCRDRNKIKAFSRTITADSFPVEGADWRQRLWGWHSDAARENDQKYLQHLRNACCRRRFFVTWSGRLGLGPWSIKKDDIVAIILGSPVPLILRRYKVRKQEAKWRCFDDSDGLGEQEYFKFVGEAYCDGLMQYAGDIQKNIQEGKLKVRKFNLL